VNKAASSPPKNGKRRKAIWRSATSNPFSPREHVTQAHAQSNRRSSACKRLDYKRLRTAHHRNAGSVELNFLPRSLRPTPKRLSRNLVSFSASRTFFSRKPLVVSEFVLARELHSLRARGQSLGSERRNESGNAGRGSRATPNGSTANPLPTPFAMFTRSSSIEGAVHFAPIEQPSKVAGLLLDWLAQKAEEKTQ
jgi:hypothetical protein